MSKKPTKYTSRVPGVYKFFSDEVKRGATYSLVYKSMYIVYIQRETIYNKWYKLDREYLDSEKYYYRLDHNILYRNKK